MQRALPFVLPRLDDASPVASDTRLILAHHSLCKCIVRVKNADVEHASEPLFVLLVHSKERELNVTRRSSVLCRATLSSHFSFPSCLLIVLQVASSFAIQNDERAGSLRTASTRFPKLPCLFTFFDLTSLVDNHVA